MTDVRCVYETKGLLGEGPLWDPVDGVLWWLDIFAPAIHRFDPTTGENTTRPLDQPIYAMVLREGGGMLGCFEDGIGSIDFETGEIGIFADPKGDALVNYNDGACDRRGRFFTGTMAKDWETPIGKLFRLDADHSVHEMADGFRISNGCGWSPDDKTFYFSESIERTVWAWDYDIETGGMSNRRRFAQIPEAESGIADGLTVDAEGYVWLALWDGWRIVRFAPGGSVDREIKTPIQRPTSVMFGGPDLKTLYITSATYRLEEADLASQPQAGSLFACEPGVAGLPEPRWKG